MMENNIQIIVFVLVGFGLLMSIIRLVIGPKTQDRIVALDTLNIMIVGLISLISLIFKNGLYLDIAIAYAILAFLETMVFARYLEGRLWK